MSHTGSGVKFILSRASRGITDVSVFYHLGCRWRQGEKTFLCNPLVPTLWQTPSPLTP